MTHERVIGAAHPGLGPMTVLQAGEAGGWAAAGSAHAAGARGRGSPDPIWIKTSGGGASVLRRAGDGGV